MLGEECYSSMLCIVSCAHDSAGNEGIEVVVVVALYCVVSVLLRNSAFMETERKNTQLRLW